MPIQPDKIKKQHVLKAAEFMKVVSMMFRPLLDTMLL